ncbi:MAG: YggT family protein [Dehalococcoidia bacterium]
MSAIATFIEILCEVLTIAIFIRAIMSWFPTSPTNRLAIMLNQVTEPILNPLRRLIPPLGGTIDITPIVAIILLQVIAAYVGGLG